MPVFEAEYPDEFYDYEEDEEDSRPRNCLFCQTHDCVWAGIESYVYEDECIGRQEYSEQI